MKILQFRKFIRIHWVILALLLGGVAWLAKPENVATAQTTEQRFSSPGAWVQELTMGQGWGPEYPRVLADINGDTIQDVIGFGIHGTWISIAPPTSSVTFALADFGYNQAWRVNQHVRVMGDVSGDQMDDIVGFGNAGVYRALSTGTGFGPVGFVVADFGYDQGWRNDKHVRLLADINGDKQKDIVGFGEHGVWVSLSMSKDGDFSAPFFAVADFGYLQGWRNDKHIRTTADVNGDTLQDIVAFGDHGVWIALANGTGFGAPQLVLNEFAILAGGWQVTRHPRLMADIDNDTMDDIIGFGNDGVWISRSTGGGFTAPQLVLGDFGYNTGWRVGLHPRYIADLNGDGYKDIVGYGQESVYRALGGPNGFTSIRGVLRALVAAEFPYSLGAQGDWAPRYVGDVTGDGMADLVAFGETHIWVARSSDQPPFEAPKAPSNLRFVEATETSMVIAWDDNSSDERRFFTYFGEPGNLTRTVRPPDTEKATYTELEPDTQYCFTVEAESIWGVSTSDRPVCGRTKPRPDPTPTPTPEPFGFSRIDVFNCNSEERAVAIWTFDHTTNVWTQHGTAPSMWANGSCPAQSSPFKVPLTDNHTITFVAVDPGLSGCGQNNPQVPFCQRSKLQLFGKSTGPVLPHTIN